MSSSNPQSEFRNSQLTAPLRERLFPNNEWVLLVVIIIECAIFSLTGNNFLTASNAFEVTRLSVEIGLLALALTPVAALMFRYDNPDALLTLLLVPVAYVKFDALEQTFVSDRWKQWIGRVHAATFGRLRPSESR